MPCPVEESFIKPHALMPSANAVPFIELSLKESPLGRAPYYNSKVMQLSKNYSTIYSYEISSILT